MARQRGLDRLVNFSDGVMAIAITLLVLQFEPPELHGRPMQWTDIFSDTYRAKYTSFVISFLVKGALWRSHHGWFMHIVGYDRRLVELNLLFPLTVCFLPFPTSLTSDAGVAFPFDAASLTAASLSSTLVGWYALGGHRLTEPELPDEAVRFMLLRSTSMCAFFVILTLVGSVWQDPDAFYLFLVAIPLSLVLNRWAPEIEVGVPRRTPRA